VLAALDDVNCWRVQEIAERVREPLLRAAAWYYVRGRNRRGLPLDSEARFHLGTARGLSGSIGPATPLSALWRSHTG
jgi:malonyl-CoA decarboxylase